MQHAASAITAPDTDQLPVYWQFHEAVTRAQLVEWLPSGRRLLVDVSGPRGPGAKLAARAGHTVVRVIDSAPLGGRPPGPPRSWGQTVPPGPVGPFGPPGQHRQNCPGDRRLITADLPGRRLRRWRHRRRPGAVRAPGRRGDDRRDRPRAAAGRPGARLRRLPGARHGRARRPASLGPPGRPAARRGGARAVAGRHDHQVLRPGPGPRAVQRGRAAGQLDPLADRVLRVGGDALAAARPRRPAQARTGRTSGPVGRVARRAAGGIGQQAPPPGGNGGRAAPP